MRYTSTLAVIVGVLASVLLCEATQAGDVYKYTDERGNVQYTDRPMPGAVKIASGSVRPPEVAARSYASQQSATSQQLNASNQRIAQSSDDQRIASNVAKDLEKSRVERCKQARDAYQSNINHRRLYRTDKDGNKVFLSDAELAQARMDAAKDVEAICGPQG
jgi:uncharacterized protein DUF4124